LSGKTIGKIAQPGDLKGLVLPGFEAGFRIGKSGLVTGAVF
jgi:hypothetical protein